jgi:hypothetical protein
MICKKHKKYKAIKKPVSTVKHPGGCKECWMMFENSRQTKNNSV